MMLGVVQSIGKAAGVGNCTFNLAAPPTTGNVLLAFVKYRGDGFTIAPPTGSYWTCLAKIAANSVSLAVFTHQVASGDGQAWTFPVSGDNTSGEMYEITGAQNLAIWAGGGQFTTNVGAAAITTPASVPAVLGCLAFGSITDNNGTSISSVSAGWTLLSDTGTFHGGGTAYQNVLTTDTSTAVDVTFTMGAASAAYCAVTVLIAPVSTEPSLYVLQNAMAAAGNSGSTVLTLPKTPAPHNIMIAAIGWFTAATLTPPGGWTQIITHANGNQSLAVYYRVVQSGDGSSYTWTNSSDYASGVLAEITGQDPASPINGSAIANVTGTTAFATPSIVPGVNGCLPVASLTADDGTGFNAIYSAAPATFPLAMSGEIFHGSALNTGPLTTGTVSGVSATFTLGVSDSGVTSLVLIAPAPVVTAAPAPPDLSRSQLRRTLILGLA